MKSLDRLTPTLLGAMDALAEIVVSREELDRGLDLYEQILDQRKGCLEKTSRNPFHPKSDRSYLRIQEKPEEAEEIQFSVYTRLKKKHGLEHPETLDQ